MCAEPGSTPHPTTSPTIIRGDASIYEDEREKERECEREDKREVLAADCRLLE
jgi:hypothetical protein